MAWPTLRKLGADARFYHRLKHAGADGSAPALLLTFLTSRGLWLLAFHRIAYYSTFNRNLRNPLWWLARLLEGVGMYWNAVISKSEVLGDCEIPGPVYLPDKGYCILGAERVGAGSIIHHRITFGMAVGSGKIDRPAVGANVWIGPDCVIAGKLDIGDGATILPGSYLTFSVPPRSVVKGNPARVVRENFDNSTLRKSLVAELPAD